MFLTISVLRLVSNVNRSGGKGDSAVGCYSSLFQGVTVEPMVIILGLLDCSLPSLLFYCLGGQSLLRAVIKCPASILGPHSYLCINILLFLAVIDPIFH